VAIYTDFFIASEEELRAAFPNRFAVANVPTLREARNPFTGQTRMIEEWGPAQPLPRVSAGITYPSEAEMQAVSQLPIVRFKGVDIVKLAALQSITSGGDLQSQIGALCCPALVAPGDENSPLFRLPRPWIEAVAGIENVDTVATKWASTEECQLDRWNAKNAAQAIEALRTLARRSKGESKGMFLWVNM
jgi:hypothetical protein